MKVSDGEEVKKTGIFETLFKWHKKTEKAEDTENTAPTAYFTTLSGYTPAYTTYEGGLYEMALTRAAIHARANLASKLKPEISGTARKSLESVLQYRPNPYMDTTKFLYRISTILDTNNTAFIVPIEDEAGALVGYYPVVPQMAEVVDKNGVPYVRYTFGNGKRKAIELSRVGILTKYAYKNDFFGEPNDVLKPTLQLMHAQDQGQLTAIRNSAVIRYIARLNAILKDTDVDKIREEFAEKNLNPDTNRSGLIVLDGKIAEVTPVKREQYTINADQMRIIQDNVYQYFGVNSAILENNYTEDQWNAFYEGAIEPFAVQLSLVMTNMTFSQREIAFGNEIMFTANRLQYASNSTKRTLIYNLLNCGVMTRNEAREILNLPRIEGPDGDKYYMRRDYAEVGSVSGLGGAQIVDDGKDEKNDEADKDA